MYYFISLLQPIGGEKVSDIIILRPKRDPTKKKYQWHTYASIRSDPRAALFIHNTERGQ